MALKAGSVADFTDSMAQAIADAFESEWLAVKETELPENGEEDRQLLFAAIAQGVVNYLRDNINGSLEVDVRVTQTNEVLMESDNPSSISVSGGGSSYIAAHAADVRQQSDAGNKIIAEGYTTNVELVTE